MVSLRREREKKNILDIILDLSDSVNEMFISRTFFFFQEALQHNTASWYSFPSLYKILCEPRRKCEKKRKDLQARGEVENLPSKTL